MKESSEQLKAKVFKCLDSMGINTGFNTAKPWFIKNYGNVGMSPAPFYVYKREYILNKSNKPEVNQVEVKVPETVVQSQVSVQNGIQDVTLSDLKRVALLVREMGRKKVEECLACLEEVQV